MFQKIAFIGAGSMAEAIVSGLVQAPELVKPEDIIVTNKVNEVRLQDLHDKYEVTPIVDKQEVVTDAEVIFLSMKPKDLQSALDEIIPYLVPGQLIISVIAGIEESHRSEEHTSE